MNKPPAKIDPNGRFGFWFDDEYGLPAYEYTCDQDNDPAATAFTTQGGSNLHWHQIGNDRVSAIAANTGWIQAFESSRGMQWLNFRDPRRLCPGAGIALMLFDNRVESDLYEPGAPAVGYKRIFGCGYFKKIKKISGIRIEHTIFAPFGDDPVFVSEIRATNTTNAPVATSLLEFFGVNIHFISQANIYSTRRRVSFGHTGIEDAAAGFIKHTFAADLLDAEASRNTFSQRFKFEAIAKDGSIVLVPHYFGGKRPPADAQSARNYYPYPLFAAQIRGVSEISSVDAASLVGPHCEFRYAPAPEIGTGCYLSNPCLALGSSVQLAQAGTPGDSVSLAFVFGYCAREHIQPLIDKYGNTAATADDILAPTAERWLGNITSFFIPGMPDDGWAKRETEWHSYYTRSASLFDEYYDCHFVPQGGAYEFLHGLRGAVRDYSLFIAALTYTAPGLARDLLDYSFRTMTPEGRVMYATSGYGHATDATAHGNPSDLQLFLLWALTEYIFFTGDSDFLDRETPYFPKGCGSATIRDKVTAALDFLYNRIGTGEHGLIRVGDGDWSDGISLFARDRRKFIEHGESTFNSAMAIYILPRVADLIEDHDPDGARRAREFTDGIKKAVLSCYNGKWFYRGYDGSGHPIGNRHLFLEHHTWLLISRALPDEMARSVVRNIYEMLDEPSSYGQYVLYPPKKSFMNMLKPGWDVNGGTWFAMNYLLAWGYGYYDREKAWAAMRKNSLSLKATIDPALWYGIWSGPDSFNADHADRPRETYFHLPTPTTDFPVMNLNVHAVCLATLIKLCGVEPTKDGFVPQPLLPFSNYSLHTPTFNLNINDGKATFSKLI